MSHHDRTPTDPAQNAPHQKDTALSDTAPDEATAQHVADRARWEASVAQVLARAQRVDVDDISAPASAHLRSTTYDDLVIEPLYDIGDDTRPAPPPGAFPFERGRDADRDTTRGWHVTAAYGGRDRDAATVNDAVLDGLAAGVSALWLTPTAGGAADVDRILDGVFLDLAPITLAAGPDTAAHANALFELIDRRSPDPMTTELFLGADPITATHAGHDTISLDDTFTLLRRAGDRDERIRTIVVDGTVFHEAGAADAQEIGLAVAAGIQYLRAGAARGVPAAEVLDAIAFRFAATDAQFETIAKFRAARRVWARVAEVVGAADRGAAPQHAVTSSAMTTRRDPWVNMLRTTLAAFGAGVGGADQVTVLAFDSALPAGASGASASFADRMAVNTQLLLLEESHVGRVVDPAGGSWYVDALTDAIAAAAWTVVQRTDRLGGFTMASDAGLIAEEIGAVAIRRESDVAHRRMPITGVSEFPNLTEKALDADVLAGLGSQDDRTGVRRYASAFESLRDRADAHLGVTGHRPTVVLAPLGTIAEYNARATFATNLMGAGGIATIDPGPTDHVDATLAAVAATDGEIAIVCGTDARYREGLDAIVSGLRSHVRRVLLAGPSAAVSDDDRDPPDGFLTLGIDAVAALSEILDDLGVDPAPSRTTPAGTTTVGTTAAGTATAGTTTVGEATA